MSLAPLFILCHPRSFSSVVCSMIGVHSEMCALPELNLFCADRVGEILEMAARPGRKNFAAGFIRTIAELQEGEQTERSVRRSKTWLRERSDWSTADMYDHVVELAAPRRCVDKSPPYTRPLNLERLFRAFPDAQFLHLGRHPRSAQKSRHQALHEKAERGEFDAHGVDADTLERDWIRAQRYTLEFFEKLAPGQGIYIKGEHLLSEPDIYLPQIAEWLGVDARRESIEAMKHTERCPFACMGPPDASGGTNRAFLENPRLRTMRPTPVSLHGPLEWAADGRSFGGATIELARQLGYQ